MQFKILLYFSLILIILCDSLKSTNLTSNLIALNDIFDTFFIKNQPFNIFYENKQDQKYSELLHSEFLAQNKEQFACTVNTISENILLYEISSIIFVYSCSNFIFVHNHEYALNEYPKALKILIYVENCSLKFIKSNIKKIVFRILTYMENGIEAFEYILINDNKSLYLSTIEYFTKAACNEPQLIILNVFSKSTQKWDKKLQNYEKFPK